MRGVQPAPRRALPSTRHCLRPQTRAPRSSLAARSYGSQSQNRQYQQQGYYEGSYGRHQDDMPPPPPPPPPGQSFNDRVQARGLSVKWIGSSVLAISLGMAVIGWVNPNKNPFVWQSTQQAQQAQQQSQEQSKAVSKQQLRERARWLQDNVASSEVLGLRPEVTYPWRHDVNGRLEVQIDGTWYFARQVDALTLALIQQDAPADKRGAPHVLVWRSNPKELKQLSSERRFRALDLSNPQELYELFGSRPLIAEGLKEVQLTPKETADVLLLGSATNYRDKLLGVAPAEEYEGRNMNSLQKQQQPAGKKAPAPTR